MPDSITTLGLLFVRLNAPYINDVLTIYWRLAASVTLCYIVDGSHNFMKRLTGFLGWRLWGRKCVLSHVFSSAAVPWTLTN